MILHADTPLTRAYGDYVVSPMYGVLDEHVPAAILVLLTPLGFWLASRWAARRPGRVRLLRQAYRHQPLARRLAAWLVAASAMVHLGLALGHDGGWALTYLGGAVALSVAFAKLLSGGSRVAALILTGSLVVYAAAGIAGSPPDQIGLATKLAEITALAILTGATSDRRFPRLLSAVLPVAMVALISSSAWVGAFRNGQGGHHVGQTPAPGVALPVLEARSPTERESAEAMEFFDNTRAGIAKYADPAVAATDGYLVDGLFGTDFHADNPAYGDDGRILDPERPETLVYADSAAGPILLGAMFQMPKIGQPGPAIGGPLTVWHAHDHVCFSLLPPGLAGLSDPFGICPAGSITIPITNEMLHVWILPGVEDPYGDLDDRWLEEYLATVR